MKCRNTEWQANWSLNTSQFMSSVFSTSLNPFFDQGIYFKSHPLRILLLTCHQNFQSFDTWSVLGSNILDRTITYQVTFMYKISSDFPIASKSFHVIIGTRQQILPKLHVTSQEAITWMLQIIAQTLFPTGMAALIRHCYLVPWRTGLFIFSGIQSTLLSS